MRSQSLTWLIIVSANTVGCNTGNGPTSPRAVSSRLHLDGTWVGTTTDSLTGTIGIRLSISQDGSWLTGSWVATSPTTRPFPDVTEPKRGGVRGSVTELGIGLKLSGASNNSTTCELDVRGGVNSYSAQNQVVAIYSYARYSTDVDFNWPPPIPCNGEAASTSGSLALTKQ